MIKIENVVKFLDGAYEDKFDGCLYMPLDDGLYLVVGYDFEHNESLVKIAYNCDSLQCDYDWDWYMPMYQDGSVAYVECVLTSNNDKLAKYLVEEAEAILQEKNNGNIVDWNCEA